MIDRRSFLTLGACPAAAALAQTPAQAPGAPAAASPFADPDFGFTAQIALGAAYYGGGDPGKLMAILSKIKPADFESAYTAYHDAGVLTQGLAQEALSKRHNVSAREAYLWAANYFSAALRMLDGTKDPDRMLGCWKEYAACWSGAAALFDPPVERVEIPYGDAALTGWFLRADGSRRRRPLIILNNGADGLEKSMYVLGGAGALARGYNCLIFNGPGQGDSLWARKLYFRPDWEKVITPVVDAMLRHREVDAKRIALIGVSQGGYWVPRALAFEHRIAAGVADPGVWDVSEPWFRTVPQMLRDMLRDGKKDAFDQMLKMGTQAPRIQGMLRMRMRPFGTASYYEVFRAVQEYKLADVAGRITCPMLITDPEGEQFFPGQSQKLHDALRCPKKLIHFTREQGAEQHCEVNAPGYRDYCIYNWLAETLEIDQRHTERFGELGVPGSDGYHRRRHQCPGYRHGGGSPDGLRPLGDSHVHMGQQGRTAPPVPGRNRDSWRTGRQRQADLRPSLCPAVERRPQRLGDPRNLRMVGRTPWSAADALVGLPR